MLTLRFDGLFRSLTNESGSDPNAGVMCYAWLIYRDDRLIARGHGGCARAMDASSNVAEYLALIEGLEALLDMGNLHEPVEIIGDAKSVIDQMREVVATISPQVVPLHQRAGRLARQFSAIQWTWEPRRYNRQADTLTRHALRQIRTDQAKYLAVLQSINPVNGRSRRTRKFFTLLDLRIYHGPKALPLPAGG